MADVKLSEIIDSVSNGEGVILYGIKNDAGTYKSVKVPASSISSSDSNYVYLAENIVGGVSTLTQSMVSYANTIYVIKYDYDLKGATVKIPTNCTLKFEGGSITNGKVFSDNKTTKVINPPVVDYGVNDSIYWGVFFDSSGKELTYKFEPYNRPFMLTSSTMSYNEMMSKRSYGITRYNIFLTTTGSTLETYALKSWEKDRILELVTLYNLPIRDLRIEIKPSLLTTAKYISLCTEAIDWIYANVKDNVERISVNNEADDFYVNTDFVAAHLQMITYARSKGFLSGIAHYRIEQPNLIDTSNYPHNDFSATNMDYYGFNVYPFFGRNKNGLDVDDDDLRIKVVTKQLSSNIISNHRRGFTKLFLSESGFSAGVKGLSGPDNLNNDMDWTGSILIRAWAMWLGILKKYGKEIDTVNMWSLPYMGIQDAVNPTASDMKELSQNLYNFLLNI